MIGGKTRKSGRNKQQVDATEATSSFPAMLFFDLGPEWARRLSFG